MKFPAIQVKNLTKEYPVGETKLRVLNKISFSLEAGQIAGVVGESGSGKSTLLHILGALDTPSSGEVLIGGFDPFTGSDRAISRFRNSQIGIVFQHNNLLPEFSAFENVMMPGLIGGTEEKVVRARAEALLRQVGMEKRLSHFPSQLSGGEQQRVAIARALINNPVLLLADEPSGNLDSKNAANIHELFQVLNRDSRTTILVITHNLEFATSLPRRIELRDGSVIRDTGA